jgi:hypothetical protein
MLTQEPHPGDNFFALSPDRSSLALQSVTLIVTDCSPDEVVDQSSDLASSGSSSWSAFSDDSESPDDVTRPTAS